MPVRLLLPLVVALSIAAPASAQTPSGPAVSRPPITADDRAIMGLIDRAAAGIDIAADQRADLDGCGGADSKGLARAVKSCWPVLQSYRTLAPLLAATTQWEALPREEQTRDTPESRAVLAAADAVIADTGARSYPAQDSPLLIANLNKALVAVAQNDLAGFVSHFRQARHIITTSAIKEYWFVRELPRIDAQIAEAEQMIDQLARLEAAKAAVRKQQ